MNLSVVLPLVLAAGCSSLVSQPDTAPAPPASLASAQDSRVRVTIESVLVRNAPGSWVKNADWDEYRFTIVSAAGPVQVKELVLIDATGARVAPSRERSKLIDDTRELELRYAQSGQLSRSESGAWIIAGGAATIAGGFGLGALAVTSTTTFAAAATIGATVAAATGVGLVIAGIGVAKLVDNSRVGDEVERRGSLLPAMVSTGDSPLVLHYAVTPLPRGVVIAYSAEGADHRLELDVRAALERLHDEPPMVAVDTQRPDFPRFAMRQGVKKGHVKLRLTVNPGGGIDEVKILEAQPTGMFARTATDAAMRWRYSEARWNRPRFVEEVLVFKMD